MNRYQALYEERFVGNLKKYASLRKRIKDKIAEILEAPYNRTERLGAIPHGINLSGCRSARGGRNFRIIFVACEECRKVEECQYCFCEGRDDKTVVFLTVGPHQKAYAMR